MERRRALNATARACAEERGLPRRALDSTQGKPCSVALLGLAFTMAEILLSLTIIGVVAAITLPSLTGNINERTWNTQRKALYARFSQAVALMPSMNGYGTLTEGDSSTSAVDTAAETFVTAGLSKVLKINNICDNDHLEDCGLPEKIIAMNGSQLYSDGLPKTLIEFNSLYSNSWLDADSNLVSYSQANTKIAAFETANGESIAVYYNPRCTVIQEQASTDTYVWIPVMPEMCANFVYDLNGSKGPNTVGKDIGVITAFGSVSSALVAPMPYPKVAGSAKQINASDLCRELGDDLRVPNLEELEAIVLNKPLFGFPDNVYWSSSLWKGNLGGSSGTKAWAVDNVGRKVYSDRDGNSRGILCIKR